MNIKLLFFTVLITLSSIAQNKNKTIGFKENKGQITDQKGKPNNAVKYLLNSGGLNVQLRKNGFSYDVYEAKKHPIKDCQNETKKPLPFPSKENENHPDYTLEYQFHRIDIDFVNSNPDVELITEEKSLNYDNYYNIPNKPEGIVGVYQYKQITYKNVYPNIDVVFTVPKDESKTVEYNFVIHPKGKISDIQLKFSGAKTELVDNKIKMQIRFGEMEETLPASWTEDGQSKKDIAVGYTEIKKNVYGFASSENISEKMLIIDPVPVRLWGTYYGEGNSCTFKDIDSDKNGNSYIVGYTSIEDSFGFYATSGAHQTTGIKDYDGIIAKFDSNGKRIWGTYYGGENFDLINGIKIDTENNIVITGTSSSTTNISTVKNSTGACFLAKFNSSGVRIWTTYFGGDGYRDHTNDIDVDSNNNIYVVGVTISRTGISINNNFQPLLNHVPYNNSSADGFLTKFNSNGKVIWSTYIGGEDEDYLNTIKVGSNYLVLGGMTYSKSYISTPNTFQTNSFNNWIDGTAYKFNLDGDRIWSTYYGGEGFDEVMSIELDNDNNVYIGGTCRSKNNIATLGSFDEFNNSPIEKGFVAKLNKDGQRIWGTYFGEYTILYSIIFKNNFLYLGGMGNDVVWESTPITTHCTYKKDGDYEGYIGKISTDGNLIMGTFVGGGAQDSENKICFDNDDNIIIGGITSSGYIKTDPDSYQPNMQGNRNFYLMKFSEDNNLSINVSPSSNSPVCLGSKLIFNVDSGYNYLWTGPNGFSSNLQNPFIDNTTTANNGVYKLIVSNDCGLQKSYDLNVVIGDIEPPIPNLTTLQTLTGDCHTSVTTIPTATDACAGIITATTASALSYNLPGTYTVVWDYDDGNGNISHQNQTITISSQPLPTAISPQPFCVQQNATLNDIAITTGQNIQWYDQLTAGNLLLNTTPLQNGNTYYASQTINGCESERIAIEIKIQDTSAPTGNANPTFCSDQNPTIANITVTGQDIKWYDAMTNGNVLPSNASLQNGRTYYASQTLNSCEGERLAVTVSIQNTPEIPTGDTNPKFCKSEKATLNNININGQNLKWYDSDTATNPLANTTLLQNNTTYYVSQTIGCESDRLAVLVNVYDTPLPIANTSKTFCIEENATINTIAVTGQNLKWYDAPYAGNVLTATTTLENKTYYVTQTNDNCESNRLAIAIKIQDTQTPLAAANQSFCVQQNSTINTIKINGQNIKWYNAETDGTDLSESTPLENGITYYASQTINDCESEKTPITIQIQQATTADCINFIDELPYPKFFTPNYDQYNDTWTIDFAYLQPNSAIKIFDRYGKLIKELETNGSWDGNYLNQPLPATDYWFVVTRLNGTEFKGHFSLKR